MLFQQYQCKAERVYFNLQFQEQFIVVGKSRWQKAEVAIVTSRLQACRSVLSFHLQSPGPKPHRMVPSIADRPSHLNLHNQDYLPWTHPNAHFPGDSRLKFTINPNPKVKVDKCPGYCVPVVAMISEFISYHFCSALLVTEQRAGGIRLSV